MSETLRQKLVDLTNSRAQQLEKAEAALAANNQADYNSAMEAVRNLNSQIKNVQDLIQEQDRKAMETPGPTGAEARDIAEERGALLMKGDKVDFTVDEVRRAVMNATTLATGTLVEPTGAGSTIRDPLGNGVSSIVDQIGRASCRERV